MNFIFSDSPEEGSLEKKDAEAEMNYIVETG